MVLSLTNASALALDAHWVGNLLFAAGCLLVGSLGVHAGAALLVYSPTKLARRDKLRQEEGDGIAKHLAEAEREYDLVAWTLAVAGVALALPPLGAAYEELGWGVLVGAAIFLLLFCVAIPVALAKTRAEGMVIRTFPMLRLARIVLHYPLMVPLMAATHGILRALRVPDSARTPEEIADEIAAAVTDSAAENALEDEERGWIENIVELKDLHVSEAMTPRTDVVAFDAEIDLLDAVHRAIETGHSRYPVFEKTVDNVVGVFYAKDALVRLSNGASKQVAIREVMRKPLFVPESMGVSELLRRFKTTKLQMAIVLDEYGGTAGLISIEDILEEIVGDIEDEYDEEGTAILISPDRRVVEISGRVRVDEVNEALEVEIPENPEYDTVAGYVFSTQGKIPKQGEQVEVEGIVFEILESDDRRIHRLRMTLAEPSPAKTTP